MQNILKINVALIRNNAIIKVLQVKIELSTLIVNLWEESHEHYNANIIFSKLGLVQIREDIRSLCYLMRIEIIINRYTIVNHFPMESALKYAKRSLRLK